jgi:hypothetical protein
VPHAQEQRLQLCMYVNESSQRLGARARVVVVVVASKTRQISLVGCSLDDICLVLAGHPRGRRLLVA